MDYKHLFSLENKVIGIIGGTGLLGKEVSIACANYGAKVAICDINHELGTKIASELTNLGLNASFFLVNIVDEKSVKQAIDDIVSKYGKIDAWVNLAYPRTKDWGNKLEDVSIESWNSNLEMHLTGYFISSRAILEYFNKVGTGNLLNFSSIYGLLGPDFRIYEGTTMTMPVAYSAIKGGINTLGKYFANYVRGKNIRVNTICPGGVFDNQTEEFVKKYSERVPLNRMAGPIDIVGPTIFLLSDASSYVNGTILLVDGGLASS